MYKRHTDFAMEHFRLYFNYSNLALPLQGNITLKTKVDRNAQLLHDCYLNVTIPDIYSPVVPFGVGQALGYEFQWIKNLGYNMINYVAVTINGTEIVRHTGEWMKLYAALKFDKAKKDIVDEMVGNVVELYDPANAYDRLNQYPHSISTATTRGAPAIPGRVLTIPLHFWFCELIGNALPLIALQHSEIGFVIELKNVYQLFTVRDTTSFTYIRIPGNTDDQPIPMSNFLSPPTYGVTPRPSNSKLLLWNLNPFIEANYIFVSDSEMAHIATSDHSFLINQVTYKHIENQYAIGDDIEFEVVGSRFKQQDRDIIVVGKLLSKISAPVEVPLLGQELVNPLDALIATALPTDSETKQVITTSIEPEKPKKRKLRQSAGNLENEQVFSFKAGES
jgi:hypothetical protein